MGAGALLCLQATLDDEAAVSSQGGAGGRGLTRVSTRSRERAAAPDGSVRYAYNARGHTTSFLFKPLPRVEQPRVEQEA